MTRVVNIRYYKYDVYIGRLGMWGNPYIIGKDGTRAEVIAQYEEYIRKKLEASFEWRAALHELAGKHLGCYCKPLACHGDVLVELIKEYGYE